MLGVTNVAWLSTVQAIVPEDLQGRYLATDNAVSYAAIPAAQIVGGFLITFSGIGFAFLVSAVGSLAVGAVLVTLRELRRVGYDPRTPAPPAALAIAEAEREGGLPP
jgi:hypothetical protein